MFNKLKQFKELRSQAKQFQSQLSEIIETFDCCGNKIKLTMNGSMEILSLDIDDSMFSDKEKLRKELKELLNTAIKKMQKKVASNMMKSGNMPDMSSFFKQ